MPIFESPYDTQAPPPPSYDNAMGMEARAVPQSVVTNVQYVASPSFGEGPVTMTCGSCQKTITTRTTKEMSSTGWVLAIVLCVVGCWPCCLIPCCMDSMQAVKLHAQFMLIIFYRQPTLAQAATSLWASIIQARLENYCNKIYLRWYLLFLPSSDFMNILSFTEICTWNNILIF